MTIVESQNGVAGRECHELTMTTVLFCTVLQTRWFASTSCGFAHRALTSLQIIGIVKFSLGGGTPSEMCNTN
jgi:hypothetical protein